ncbi:hypothetical protein BU26DRAFT_584494 [Trematosphaeria pertusa]|uniref:DUF7580 domain-containing protein n=1 Tax=Trematosphaeria pertusa TaxID=390896 RepID=A0A6A6HW87_9PLEO|nr:uncharacterized protein BU26DRAFT_584494 [Trematosphaeria pertusa]KAF2242297.1 hypothetical protein BU26DRAFT_584494 [Trematosphaeria pertusa]
MPQPGCELAGVILGSVPLVISALEHYREGLAVMKNMRDYEDVFNDIQSQFGASVSIYMNSCYQLLGPLNLPDQQVIQLLEQRRKAAWSDAQLRRAIESRLGPNYKAYVSLMEKLNKRIELLCKKLKLNDDLKPPWVGTDDSIDEMARKKFFKSIWTKIRGGFGSAKYSMLLQDIDRDIDKISKLTSGAIQLEPLRTEKKKPLRFYSCTCNHPHQANLRLDLRNGNDIEGGVTRFAFLLTFKMPECVPKVLPWTWRDIEIESLQFLPPHAYATSSRHAQEYYAHRPIRDHFAIINIYDTFSDTSTRDQNRKPLQNPCRWLQARMLSWYTCRPSLVPSCVSGDWTWQQQPNLGISITERNNLQRQEDCNKAESWGTKDIFILQGHSGDLLPSAYVSLTFSPSAIQTAAKRRRCVKNEQVFALGVALLELAHGSPLLSHITPDDLNDEGQQDSMTEVSIATRLADHINKFESENYARAVLRCIRFNFDSFSFDFKDKEFREKFFEGVVVPLQENWEFVTGGKL